MMIGLLLILQLGTPPVYDRVTAAVGVGTELISKGALERRDYAAIGARAKQFLEARMSP